MEVFDREFEVALLSYDDKSKPGNPDVNVSFTTGGEVYHYRYAGSGGCALGYVWMENRQTFQRDIVYSPWKHIPEGSYYEQIGRTLSIEQRTKSKV